MTRTTWYARLSRYHWGTRHSGSGSLTPPSPWVDTSTDSKTSPCQKSAPQLQKPCCECNRDISTVGELLVRYRFLGSSTRNNSTRIIVVRKAEPGTIEKNNHQMVWGKPARTGDRLKVSQSPTICVANSNAKSKACLRVSSMVTSSIVAPLRQMAKSGDCTSLRRLFAGAWGF